jgi:hypothetical protein
MASMSPTGSTRGAIPRSRFPLTEKELRDTLASKTWSRAQDYVGGFFGTEACPREIRGEVTGNYGTYTTVLRRVGDALECVCSCPAAEDMDCKHAAALGLTYLRDPGSFKELATADRTEVRALVDISKFLKGTSLEELVTELRDRGITQKQVVEILGINSGLFGSAKRLEKRGQRYGFLNACKLACAYLLGVVESQGRPDQP